MVLLRLFLPLLLILLFRLVLFLLFDFAVRLLLRRGVGFRSIWMVQLSFVGPFTLFIRMG